MFSTYNFSEILSGIGDELRNHGYDLLLFMISPLEKIDYAKVFQSQKVDACIILGAQDSEEHLASLQELHRLKLPFCLINQRYEGCSFLEVDADHERGSSLAVEHLLAQGYHKIAFINGSSMYSNSRDRAAGYVSSMKKSGLDAHLHQYYEGNYSRKSGYLLAPEIWDNRNEIDAVVVANDRMAIGLHQGLHEIDPHRQHPFALIGCDDSDAARLHQPALTSIHVPFFEMGKVATLQVIQQLKNGQPHLPIRNTLATHLVIRESTRKK